MEHLMADLIMLNFDSVHGAQSALGAVRALEELDYAWIDDVAVVEKHQHGHISLHTPHRSLSGGAWAGALVGMLALWWFPPAWFLLGAVGGAAVGAGVGELMKQAGLDDTLVDRVKGQLTNGSSALLLIGVTGDVDQMSRAFESHHPTNVIREPIPEATVDHLKEKLAG